MPFVFVYDETITVSTFGVLTLNYSPDSILRCVKEVLPLGWYRIVRIFYLSVHLILGVSVFLGSFIQLGMAIWGWLNGSPCERENEWLTVFAPLLLLTNIVHWCLRGTDETSRKWLGFHALNLLTWVVVFMGLYLGSLDGSCTDSTFLMIVELVFVVEMSVCLLSALMFSLSLALLLYVE